jgi:drug/metabolite transporter (DMT)-like permease
MGYTLVCLSVVSSGLAQVMLKKSSEFAVLKEFVFFVYFILGGLFYVLSFGLYAYLLKVFSISEISPVMTVATMIIVILAGSLVFKESISAKQVFGVVLGVVSIMLIIK